MNIMPKHIPFLDGKWKFSVGLKEIEMDSWLDKDQGFDSDIEQKIDLSKYHTDEVFVELPESRDAQEEVLHLMQSLLRFSGTSWTTRTIWRLPLPSLMAAGLAVQEDLCIMTRKPEAWILSAGSINFPSFWSPKEKLGKSLDQMHMPVPKWNDKIGKVITQRMDELPVGAPYERFNWTITTETNKFQPCKIRNRKTFADPTYIKDNFFVRTERQILYKLEKSKDILFTIRTYLNPISFVETDHSLRIGMRDAILSSDADTLEYKGVSPEYRELLLEYLNGK
jgi:hypothetical protein